MKTIFAKFNSERLPAYQIVTKIVVDKDGIRHASKEPLCDEAKVHIKTIYNNYDLLKSTYDTNLVKPRKVGSGLLFDMADGKSLENILLSAIELDDKVAFANYIDRFVEFVDSMVYKRDVVFEASQEFEAVFGKWATNEPQDIIRVANVDLIFGNIFIDDEDKFTLIDYEWVFDFEVPKSYIIWRSLAIFSAYHQVNLSLFASYDFDISDENFLKLDTVFGAFVHGKDRQYFLPDRVRKQVKHPKQVLEEMTQKIDSLDNELKEVYMSKSWKITKPLRSLTGFVRGLIYDK